MCVGSQGPTGRLTERSEGAEARRAEFVLQLVLDKKAAMIIRAIRVQWHGEGMNYFFRRFLRVPVVKAYSENTTDTAKVFRLGVTLL